MRPPSWSALDLPPDVGGTLRQIVSQVRKGGRSRAGPEKGVTALFCGDNGTRRTLGAQFLAADLGVRLFRVDLSDVVNSYIGETEKNLRQVLDAAEAGGGVIFFDEADALFSKRTEVRDNHDRYANLEANYLLQRMEEYPGVSILATNSLEGFDPALLRRFRFIVRFPLPRPAKPADVFGAR